MSSLLSNKLTNDLVRVILLGAGGGLGGAGAVYVTQAGAGANAG
jgi:hypothetical protein